MAFLVLLAAVVLLAAPGVTDRYGRRLSPSEWSKLCAAALASGIVLLEVGLVLLAGPVVLRAVGAPSLAAACERMVGPLLPGGAVAGWSAAALGALLPAVGLGSWRRLVRVRDALAGDLWLGEDRHVGGRAVVVLPVERPLAFSLGGMYRSVVVSTGLQASLSETELAVVVAHEAAHVDHRHERFVSLAAIADDTLGWFRPVRRSVAAQRLALERWADERAATSVPDGRRVLAGSLARLGCDHPIRAVAAFSEAETVAARVAALRTPPAPLHLREHVLTYVPGTAAVAVALTAIVSWSGHANTALVMAGRCPA